MLIKPEQYIEDENIPIICRPFFNKKKGEFQYADVLDIPRIHQDSFTYISGILFQKTNGQIKLKVNLSVLDSEYCNDDLGHITTYAHNEKTKAFNKQLRRIYGTGRREDVPAYVFHKSKIDSWLAKNGLDSDRFDRQSGVSIAHSGKYSGYTEFAMRDCFCTILSDNNVPVAVFITMGMFHNGFQLTNESVNNKAGKVSECPAGVDPYIWEIEQATNASNVKPDKSSKNKKLTDTIIGRFSHSLDI